jgi:ribonuclease HI
MSELVAYVDGGSHGNPGPSGIGVIIQDSGGTKFGVAKWIGHHDNNVAEYVALMEALQIALTMNATTLRVYSDSEVVVHQMNGVYNCQSPRLYSLNWTCKKLAKSLDFSIIRIPRKENLEANSLANRAARSLGPKSRREKPRRG